VQWIAAGEGIELPVGDQATLDWLLDRVEGRDQIGGTGAQAAKTLAHLGFPAVVHVGALSPIQAQVLETDGSVFVATADGLRRVEDAARPGDPTMWHVALEFQAGLTVQIGMRAVTAPHANRIIVSYDPVSGELALDPSFVGAVETAPDAIRRVLISGFTQVLTAEAMERAIEATLKACRRWRLARPGLLVHLEVATMPEPGQLAPIVEALATEIDSLGLNVDELRQLLGDWGMPAGESVREVLAALGEVRRRLEIPRVGLHSQRSCLAVTGNDPAVERDALLFASLVASTRARIGTFPGLTALAETIDVAEPDASGLTAIGELRLDRGVGRQRDDWVVAIPSMAFGRPAATVGLGDSFTGGLLAML
jgi:ADP-dependent phosphofructokinase/glucokinase